MKTKKMMALRAAALVGAVSGVALIVSANTPVSAAEESCWQQPDANGKERYMRGCAYNQYILAPGLRPADGGSNQTPDGDFDTGSGGVDPGPGPDPGPYDN